MAGPSPPPPQTSFAGLNGTRCRLRAREPRAACVARAGPASCSRKSPRLGSKSHRGKGAGSGAPVRRHLLLLAVCVSLGPGRPQLCRWPQRAFHFQV